MKVYWSWNTVILYISIAIVISLLFGKTIRLKKQNDKSRYFYYFIIYLIMIFFACTRAVANRIGGMDSAGYIYLFQNSTVPVNFNLGLTLTFQRK